MPIAMAAGSSRCTLHSLLNKYYCGLQLPRAALLPSSNIHRQIHKSAETSAVLKTSRHALTAIGRTPHASPGTEYALMRGHLPTKLTAPCHWQPTHDCPHLKLYCNIAMSQRRFKSSRPDTNTGSRQDHTNGSDHSHSHSIFHSHSHDEHEHTQSAEGVLKALQGGDDRGSRITLVGLYSNIVLTGTKGIAAWHMNSASLLADAAHSMSDLLGDFVTLFCWKLSRAPPSPRYPYGFSKFETLGTTTVSLMLIGGALGIGFHSYHLLIQVLATSLSTLPEGSLSNILSQVVSVAQQAPSIGHVHGHHSGVLDPNAAWFAAISILIKEWLYRITKKVADEEHSPVLYANAVHHRSDAYSSIVALVAILGSWLYPTLPLDPFGGMVVAIVILQQGYALLKGAFAELTDAGVSNRTRESLWRALDPLLPEQVGSSPGKTTTQLIAIRQLRAKRAGSLIFVDLTVDVPNASTVGDMSEVEQQITNKLKEARGEVSEVRIRFCPVDTGS